jgi:hypothetical protein
VKLTSSRQKSVEQRALTLSKRAEVVQNALSHKQRRCVSQSESRTGEEVDTQQARKLFKTRPEALVNSQKIRSAVTSAVRNEYHKEVGETEYIVGVDQNSRRNNPRANDNGNIHHATYLSCSDSHDSRKELSVFDEFMDTSEHELSKRVEGGFDYSVGIHAGGIAHFPIPKEVHRSTTISEFQLQLSNLQWHHSGKAVAFHVRPEESGAMDVSIIHDELHGVRIHIQTKRGMSKKRESEIISLITDQMKQREIALDALQIESLHELEGS